MPAPNLKTTTQKVATLARVRENQRRCRARRRERISELEHRVQELEAGKDLNDDNDSNELRRLERENRRLRALLEAAGLPRLWIDTFLKTDQENSIQAGDLPEQQDTQAIPTRASSIVMDQAPRHLTPGILSSCVPDSENHQPNVYTSVDAEGGFDFLNWTDMSLDLDLAQRATNLADSPVETVASKAASENQLTSAFSINTCCAGNNDCPSLGISDSGATLCSEAFELIKKCNKKGLDMFEISIRLWSGFRTGERGRPDCTVDNNILFGVLDYVAG